MRADIITPRDLDRPTIEAWRRVQAAHRELSSPYLSPGWAQLMGRVRADARIVVFTDNCGARGFLPVQRHDRVAALPLGGPICDYQAIVARHDMQINPRQALRALDVDRIDFSFVLSDHPLTATRTHSPCDGHLIRFEDGWAGYESDRKRAGSQVLKRARKKMSKFDRERGGVEFSAFTRDEDALRQLLDWKSEQHLRTGATDVLGRSWVRGAVEAAYASDDPHFGGALFTLRAGGDLAAALFCLRGERTLHAWFVAYNPAYETYSPGLLLFVEAIRAAADQGYGEFDFGCGNYRFKQSLANASRRGGPGYIGGTNVATACRAVEFGVREALERLPLGPVSDWPGKAMRRLDVWRGLSGA